MISGFLRIQHLHEARAYQKKPHFHDVNEMLFTMNDDAVMYINQDAFPIRKGTLTLLSTGCLHAKVNNKDHRINSYVIHYPASLLSELSTPSTDLYALFAEANMCLQLEKAEHRQMLRLFESLDMDGGDPGIDLHNLCTFVEILLCASRSIRANGIRQPQYSHRDDKWLKPILNFIDHHLTEPLTLERLSAEFYISKGNLCTTFRKKTGYTIISYINMQRIRMACILLRQGDSVQETGRIVGFRSAEHFIRTFTKYVQTTPGQYQKTVRSGLSVPIPLMIYQFETPKNA